MADKLVVDPLDLSKVVAELAQTSRVVENRYTLTKKGLKLVRESRTIAPLTHAIYLKVLAQIKERETM